MNDVSMKAMQKQIDMVKNELRNEMKTSIQTSLSNQTNEIKNMMASLLQMNTASTSRSGSLPSNTVANPKDKLKAITTYSGLVTDGPTIPTPPKSITRKVDERVEETYTDPDLAEYTIKVPPPPVQKYKPPSQREFVKMLKAPLSNKEKLQELENTPLNENCSAVILKKLPEKLGDHGKFLIPCGFSELKVPLILGRPFLRTARALIDVHREEMILRGGDERLTLNMKHDTSSYSNQPQRESVNLINIFDVSSEDFLEEFTNELALITYPPEYDDNLQFDIESDLKEIEFLLYKDKDSSLKDSIDQNGLANFDAIFVDPIHEMFTDEHTLDYSSPPKFDGEKIKESKLLIDELDLPGDFLPHFEYDSFISQDFFRVDALPSKNNEDKVFNPDIIIEEKPVKIITRVVYDKKLAIYNASLVLEDFDPPFYEPHFFKEVPKKILKAPLSNKEKLQELANTPLHENCSAVILKKLLEKLGDHGKFLIPCGFSELKYKALTDLGAIINLMPLSVWKELGLPELIPTRMTLELANHAIGTPAGIARDVFIPVVKFTFSADFVIVDYKSDPRVPLILGRPFLRTARALIDIHREEMILHGGDERLTLNMKHDTSSNSNQPQRESVNLINIFDVSSEDFLEVLFSNQPSVNPTFSPHQELTSPKVTNDIFD
nr:reverse transcriptase domain-containing protein [Tanacetum cinerariifolium]